MENKQKHLEFLQAVISRMNTNSFLIKGWAITLVSALFALAAKDSNIKFVLVTYISIPTFWLLDSFYLALERQYRGLYEKVTITNEYQIDFKMNASAFNIKKNRWICAIFSKSVILFYGVIIATTLLVMFLIK
jgi:hypothetical protein